MDLFHNLVVQGVIREARDHILENGANGMHHFIKRLFLYGMKFRHASGQIENLNMGSYSKWTLFFNAEAHYFNCRKECK